jgi:hypothetical protein
MMVDTTPFGEKKSCVFSLSASLSNVQPPPCRRASHDDDLVFSDPVSHAAHPIGSRDFLPPASNSASDHDWVLKPILRESRGCELGGVGQA